MRVVGSRVSLVGGEVRGSAFAGSDGIIARRGIQLDLVTDDGHSGVGEASPLPGFHRETPREVVAALTSIHERIASIDLASPAGLVDVVARASRALPPSARFALETALSDAVGQARNEDVAHLLGGESARRTCEVCAFVGRLGTSESVESARRAARIGFRAMKLKTSGLDLEADARALEEFRASLPSGVELRLDLNGALDVGAARKALEVYRRAGVALVEEPTKGRGLLEIGTEGAPWFADEALADDALARALLRSSSCAGFVIKPALLGLLEARTLALAAFDAGKAVVVTHMFDGPVALAAACELALSLPHDPLACGLEAHAGLTAYPERQVPQLVTTGALPLIRRTGRAGLGLGASSR